MDGIKQSTENEFVWTDYTVTVCVRERERQRENETGKPVCFKQKVTVCGERKGWRGRKPERKPELGCLPGCCSLGPLTGTSTLFSNTAHRQPDNTKTLIYTTPLLISLSPPLFFCTLLSLHPLSLPVFLFHYLCIYTSVWLCFVICACVLPIFYMHTGLQADRNGRPGSHRLH